MLEIIPNWHPIFVHFTVALFSLAAGLFIVTPFLKPSLQDQWRIVARWALWFGAGITVITGLTGFYAYNTVAHDTPSHSAMTDHRNWAMATIALFLVIAVWTTIRVRRQQILGIGFIAVMVIASGVLASTAWRGGELVYRYGLGVMSLPKAEAHAHENSDSGGHGRAGEPTADSSAMVMSEEHHEQVDAHNTEHTHSDQAMRDVNVENGGAKDNSKGHHDDGYDNAH